MILFAAILLAQPNLVTLEDICIGGADGFTDERGVTVMCPVEPDYRSPAEIRRLLCHGPTENILDDDPGLALYRYGTLARRTFDLISDRTEACASWETTELENGL